MAKVNPKKKSPGAFDMEYPIIGKSKAVTSLIREIKRLAKSSDDLFIVGEPGVGKGAVAKNIYGLSNHGGNNLPFVTLNLAVIDDRELNSILFGEENQKGGTFLIEEIEEATLRNQMKIVKFIKERGSNGSGKSETNLRLIVTGKDDPHAYVDKERMLDDLAELLSAFERIEVPPLRERPEDIPVLVSYYTSEACREMGIEEPIVDINAVDVLVRQPWRENLRELRSIIDRSVMFSTGGMFTLPPELTDEKTEVIKMINNILTGKEFEINKSLDTIERGIVERTLERFGFNQSKAAQFLGMTEQTLRYRLKRLGVSPSRQR